MKRELLTLVMKTAAYWLAWSTIEGRFRTDETRIANLQSEVRRYRAEAVAHNALLLPPPSPN